MSYTHHEEETPDGFKLRIIADEDAQDPRAEYDHVGTLYVPRGNRYLSGDKGGELSGDPEDVWAILTGEPDEDGEPRTERYFYAPVGAYIHSGITVWMGAMGASRTSGPCPWDSGTIGMIYCTEAKARETWPGLEGAELASKVEECFRAEIQEFDQFLTGDVYGYVVESPEGVELDSLWSLYGSDYALEEGRGALKSAAEREREAKADYEGRC